MIRKIISVLILSLALAVPVFAGGRVALVIGNGAYTNSPLNNPVNDAMDIEKKLRELHFDTILETDCDLKEMDEALKKFYKKSRNAEIALFYFSGHGAQTQGTSYILPVDHNISTDDDIKRQAIDVNEVVDRIHDSGCETAVLILDACRNDPFGRKTRGSQKGLALVTPASTSDFLFAFACEIGMTADDGNGEHSPFTESLLNHLSDHEQILDILMDVRFEVQGKTDGRQAPYYEPHLSRRIFLNGRRDDAPPEYRYVDRNLFPVWPFILCMILTVVLAACIIFLSFTKKGRQLLVLIHKKYEKTASSIKARKEQKKQERMQKDSLKTQDENTSVELETELVPVPESEQPEKKPVQNGGIPFVEMDELIVAKYPVTVGLYNSLVPEQSHIAWETEPVTDVSWYDALRYLNRLSEKEGLEPVYDLNNMNDIKIDPQKNGWRLPTEEEWKKIARSAKKGSATLEETAWTAGNSGSTVHAVGQAAVLANGIYDLFGLVWEWCEDTVQDRYRVAKGGAWDADSKYCDIYFSQKLRPGYAGDSVGFRGVRNR